MHLFRQLSMTHIQTVHHSFEQTSKELQFADSVVSQTNEHTHTRASIRMLHCALLLFAFRRLVVKFSQVRTDDRKTARTITSNLTQLVDYLRRCPLKNKMTTLQLFPARQTIRIDSSNKNGLSVATFGYFCDKMGSQSL